MTAGADAAVSLVVGSPGSGKSSLLGQWARAEPDTAVCWLNCDNADLDPTRFWFAVIAAISRQVPGFGAACLDLLALSSEIDQDILECLLASCEALTGPVTLVLDDFQFVGREAHDHLRFLLQRGVRPLRLMVGSRSEPHLGLDRLRLADRLCEIRDADLRFSVTEAAQLLGRLGVLLDRAQLGVVLDRTEGWAAGLQLAGVALRDAGRPEDFVARLDGSTGVIGHYLWTEVFEAQSDEVKRFLLDTCVVDELHPGLAAALSPGTPVTLLDIEAANLLLVRLDPAGETFRYHHLLAQMLRFRLRSTAADHEVVLHRRAAEWLARHGDSTGAFRHRWRAGQRTTAIASMHGTVLDAYADDVLPEFDGGDRSLTDDDLVAAPGPAISYSTVLLIKGFLEDSDRLAARLEVIAGAKLDRLAWQQLRAVRAIDAFCLGDTGMARREGEALVALVGNGEIDPDWFALGITAAARSLVWEGDHAAAAALLDGVTVMPRTRVARTEHASSVAFCKLIAGELSSAESLAEAHLQELAAASAPGVDIELAPLGVVGSVQLERGGLVAAERLLQRVNASDASLRVPIRVWSRMQLSRIWRARGDFDAAFATLNGAFQLVRRRPPGSGLVDRLNARLGQLYLDADEPERAERVIDSIDGDALRAFGQLRHRIVVGDLTAACALLDRLDQAASTPRRRLEIVLGRLLVALATETAVEDAARRVFDVGAAYGFVFPIAEAGSAALGAVVACARRQPTDAYVAALMTAQPATPASSVARPGGLIESLSERERTVLRYLATSMTYREIADELYVSVNTIKTHTKNIIRKLQATSRSDALARARQFRYL